MSDQDQGGSATPTDPESPTEPDVTALQKVLDALTDGHAGFIVDYPDLGGARLQFDAERAAKLRPYWVPIRKDDASATPTTDCNKSGGVNA